MQSGHFRWRPADPARPASGRNMPIDSFLRALAADRGSKAIGVVLSGTASDGTLGLRRSRPRAASPSLRKCEPRSSTACREAPSPPAWWILCCRRPESRGNWWPSRAILRSRSSLRKPIEPPGDAGLGQDPPAGAQRHRSGLHPLQAQHPRAAHQAAHGPPRIRNAGRLQPGSRTESRGSQRVVRDLLYHRHCILSRTGESSRN